MARRMTKLLMPAWIGFLGTPGRGAVTTAGLSVMWRNGR
jgi:hypothetical protein